MCKIRKNGESDEEIVNCEYAWKVVLDYVVLNIFYQKRILARKKTKIVRISICIASKGINSMETIQSDFP